MKDLLNTLLQKAQHDLDTAQRIGNEKPELTDIVTFHCQQTIEKSLKAYLVYRNTKIKTNHDLTELIVECSSFDKDFSQFQDSLFYRLDEVGMSVRYTDIDEDPTSEEAREFLSLAKNIYNMTLTKIPVK